MRTNSERLSEVVESLELESGTKSVANELYTQAYNEELYQGRSTAALIGAVVYLATRLTEDVKTPNLVADAAGAPVEDVLSSSRYLIKMLSLPTPPTTPQSFVSQFARELDMSLEFEEIALEISTLAVEEGLYSGHSPTGYAAGSTYAASILSGKPVTQKEISEVANVSTVTIRNCYKEQLDLYRELHE